MAKRVECCSHPTRNTKFGDAKLAGDAAATKKIPWPSSSAEFRIAMEVA
jgi:hypothetical protein